MASSTKRLKKLSEKEEKIEIESDQLSSVNDNDESRQKKMKAQKPKKDEEEMQDGEDDGSQVKKYVKKEYVSPKLGAEEQRVMDILSSHVDIEHANYARIFKYLDITGFDVGEIYNMKDVKEGKTKWPFWKITFWQVENKVMMGGEYKKHQVSVLLKEEQKELIELAKKFFS